MKSLKKYFITGLISIIPVSLTVYVLVFMFRFLDGILGRFINQYLKKELGVFIPGIGLILSVCLIFIAGFMASWFIGRKIFQKLENLFSGLPLVKNIYPAFKQLVLFLLAQKEFGFQKVVLVEYPSKGLWSVGFLTNDQFPKISGIFNKAIVSVFVPSSPGPLTGYVVFVPREDLRFPDISVSDALKIIISGGVVPIQG